MMQYLVSQVLFPLLHVLLVPRLDQLHHPPHGPAPGHLHRLLADLLLVVIEHLLHEGDGGLAVGLDSVGDERVQARLVLVQWL